MTDYLALLRQKKPAGATAQTVKSTLHGLCSSPIALKSPISSEITSSHWLVHLMERDPLEVSVSPAASHPQVRGSYPDPLAAEPIEARRRQPDTLLAGDQEAAVLAWLAQIGETDQAIVGEVLTACRYDCDARAYYLGRAGANPQIDGDRRCCSQCSNLRSGVCVVAQPSGLVSAIVGYRPASPSMLQRCAGWSPNASDTDQRPGRYGSAE